MVGDEKPSVKGLAEQFDEPRLFFKLPTLANPPKNSDSVSTEILVEVVDAQRSISLLLWAWQKAILILV